tara:strand:+ start:95 stop:406 length:312 start_codon:yes stop_codon:yes gene_type:complete
MKNTIEKDKRRNKSYSNKSNYKEAWNISHKYSSYLIKHIDNENLYEICHTIYHQYLNELNNKKLIKSKNYLQVWETMINTVNKNTEIKPSIRILYQTSCQRRI